MVVVDCASNVVVVDCASSVIRSKIYVDLAISDMYGKKTQAKEERTPV